MPDSIDGFAQEPLDGISFAHTFDNPQAGERHTGQYFEMFGSRAIYKDGWWACARLDKAPWDFSPTTIARFAPGVYDPDKDVWDLYYLPDDFSQARNLADENPGKLAELKDLFWSEAERNRVLPLLGGMSVFFGLLPPLPTITRFAFQGGVQNIQRGTAPASKAARMPSKRTSWSSRIIGMLPLTWCHPVGEKTPNQVPLAVQTENGGLHQNVANDCLRRPLAGRVGSSSTPAPPFRPIAFVLGGTGDLWESGSSGRRSGCLPSLISTASSSSCCFSARRSAATGLCGSSLGRTWASPPSS